MDGKAKLTPTQKKRLCELVDAGPQAAGFDTACWNSILIQQVIKREFGVEYTRYYVCELLRNLGYSFQKARFVSDHLDEARRQAWLNEEWPRILKEARRRKALILFGDECSFAQWGSLSYTWARRGHQPTVKTSGKRKGYKVLGLIEYFSGRLFFEGLDGKFNSDQYQAFLQKVMDQTTRALVSHSRWGQVPYQPIHSSVLCATCRPHHGLPVAVLFAGLQSDRVLVAKYQEGRDA